MPLLGHTTSSRRPKRSGDEWDLGTTKAGNRSSTSTIRTYLLPRSPLHRLLLLVLLLAVFSWTAWTGVSSSSSRRNKLGIQLARPKDRVPHPAHPAADAPDALIHRRLVAVADLHGDYEHALNVLEMANLIDASPEARLEDGTPRWVGGHDVLVSTGDIVDRGTDTIKLYRMFASLRRQASGLDPPGKVVNLLGNHEVMNALKDWRYVTSADLDSFGGARERRKAISSTGWIGMEWLDHYNITASVDLLPREFLPEEYETPRANFVHGGITPEWAASGGDGRDAGIDRINTLGTSFLRKALSNPNPDGRSPPDTTPTEASLYSADGPLWYRGYALDASDSLVCSRAENASHLLLVDFLIMGHTPNFDGVVVRCPQAKIMVIDTGISRAYGGEQSAVVFDTELQRAPTPDVGRQLGLGSPAAVVGGMKKTVQAGKEVEVEEEEEEVTPMEHSKGMHRWVERRSVTALYVGRVPKTLHMGERDVWL
ncbi:unnamed protein product [Tilletia laevis]|nr:unnamed protein product [Tilletia laevis]CAD6953557.1 unnamed protein product [Tilletia caries]CAD6978978.1 unnamed protein product [Tilletia controversa]CAD6934160.1 unnamed protein product [Tilletia laevis]CAD6954871.1 unnamed protein product [Tilletia caries]